MIIIEALKDGYLNIHDAEIYYRIYGDSENENTLLFIHGNGEDWTCFQRQLEVFSKDYRVITMDSRGHGRSMAADTTITLKQIAKDAVMLLQKLGVNHAALIGFSDGANAALEIALNSTFKIDFLVLAGSNLSPSGVKFTVQFPIIIGYYLCSFIAKFDKKALHNASVLGLMVKEPHINPGMLAKITVPSLVIAGQHDMIKESHTRLIARSIPKAQVKIIPGANHFVFGKWADETNQTILTFLKNPPKR